ncbi:hypothetical protein O5D80_004988 [Batrachochytrium dendrobatidis]|nr:hypothetical protein O5D80_004988 [Batrachochytrium dendrobatidis]
MKFVDILFILTAAATANAILIPFKKDDTSRGPQYLIDGTGSRTSSQMPAPTNVAGPSTSSQGQQHMDEAGSGISDEEWDDLFDADSSSTSDEDWDDAELDDPSVFMQRHQQSMDQPGPSTSNQDQQEPMEEGESGNIRPEEALLDEEDQHTLADLKKRVKVAESKQRGKCRAYFDYVSLGLKQKSVLAKTKAKFGTKHSPSVQSQMKQECEDAKSKLKTRKQQLTKFMEDHGLILKAEPESN